MKTKELLKLIFTVCLVFVLLDLTFLSAWAASSSKPTGELRIGVPTLHNETFHPYRAAPSRKFYLDIMNDYLVGVNEMMEPDPTQGLAYKWEEAPDHLSWTFWIRDGVKFHDGSPVTLEDVKYSIETIVDPKNTIGPPNWKPYLDRVEIVQPNKIVIYLKKPWIIMLYYGSPTSEGLGVILPKKYLEKKGVEYFDNHPIGTGPYKFLEKKEGNYIKFVAQDHHFRVGTPKYKYITFQLMAEEGTREAALRKGEIDITPVSIARAGKLEPDGFPIRQKTANAEISLVFLRIFEPDNPLNKKKVRQALVYAIDKPSILKHVMQGRGRLMGHTIYMYYTSPCYKEYPVTPYDPKKAKQLLAEAGYPDGFTIYLYSFAISVPEQKLVNEAIAGYWEAIGMDVKVLEMDYGGARPVYGKIKKPLGPATLTYPYPTRITGAWHSMFGSSDLNMFSQVKDPEMDKLLGELAKQVTFKGYIKYEREIEDMVLEKFYNSGIVAVGALFGTQKEVPNWNLGRVPHSYRFEYIGATK